MQSQSRKINRISQGRQNPNPNSTKVSKFTQFESPGFAGYRKGRGNK